MAPGTGHSIHLDVKSQTVRASSQPSQLKDGEREVQVEVNYLQLHRE